MWLMRHELIPGESSIRRKQPKKHTLTTIAKKLTTKIVVSEKLNHTTRKPAGTKPIITLIHLSVIMVQILASSDGAASSPSSAQHIRKTFVLLLIRRRGVGLEQHRENGACLRARRNPDKIRACFNDYFAPNLGAESASESALIGQAHEFIHGAVRGWFFHHSELRKPPQKTTSVFLCGGCFISPTSRSWKLVREPPSSPVSASPCYHTDRLLPGNT